MTNAQVACKLAIFAEQTGDKDALEKARKAALIAGATHQDWYEAYGKWGRDLARFGRTRWSDR